MKRLAKKYLKKKVFGVNMFGWGTLALVMIGALVMGLVPNAIVVPVTKNSQWVMFYSEDMDHWQLNSRVAEKDFENQGWNLIERVGVGERSQAQAGWDKFDGEYRTNPAICLIDSGQTPTYDSGPYYWGWFLYKDAATPGMLYTASYDKHKEDTSIVGNAKKYDADEYNLIKFTTHQGRTLVIVWTGIRFDTGQLQGYVLAWRWVAVYGAFHEKNWYILDNRGNIIDSEIIPGDPEEPNGENPEDNPLLHPEEGADYTNPDEALPEELIYDPARQTRAILLIVGLLAVLVAMGGFTLWFGKKIGLFT